MPIGANLSGWPVSVMQSIVTFLYVATRDRMSLPTAPERSALMARVRTRDTSLELQVRRLLRELGVGYRLHPADLPGKPDIVMRGRRVIIFVNGCYWHHHGGCRLATLPKANRSFWAAKFQENTDRDTRICETLEQAGWRVLTVWQCEVESGSASTLLRDFLKIDR